MLKEIFNEQCNELCVSIFMYLSSGGVLPLEAGSLLGVSIGVVLNSFEYSGSELCS